MKRILVLLTIMTALTYAGSIYVDGSAGGSNDGSSWNNAYIYLQDALSNSSSGDIIYVAQGTYYPDLGVGQTNDLLVSSFYVPSGVAIYGGYSSGGGSRGIESYLTILSGNIGEIWSPNDNAYNVVTISNANSQTILDGLVISDGMGTGPAGKPTEGAGIWSSNSSMVISNCTIKDNYCHNMGGGIYVEDVSSNPSIINCKLYDNQSLSGGAIYLTDITSLTISGTKIYDNSCLTGGHGGALYFTKAGLVDIKESYIYGNSSTYGGGINMDTSNASIVNSIISGNYAENRGGAFFIKHAQMDLKSCTINGNYANGLLGGICQEYCTSSLMTVIENTIMYGDKGKYSGGTYRDEVGNALGNTTMYISYKNCNITGSGGSENWESFFGTDLGGNIDLEPLFVSETDYEAAPTTAGDLHLEMGSPCLGTGVAVEDAPVTDLDGSSRPLPAAAGNVDMGAYEKDESDIPSAVRLQSFEAEVQNACVFLSWETAGETENAGFNLYRDGEFLAFVKGAGTVSETRNYSITDNAVVLDQVYIYELRSLSLAQEESECSNNTLTVDVLNEDISDLDFSMDKAYPNPFNPQTLIKFSINQSSYISLDIYDTNGHLVETLLDKEMAAGDYSISWSPKHLPAGIYLVNMRSLHNTATRKILYVK